MSNRTALVMGMQIDPHKGPLCPLCGSHSVLISSKAVYGYDYGMIWKCHKGCNTFVGVHKTGKYQNYPLGTLADKPLREIRIKGHNLFDKMWKESKDYSREKAYSWLCEQMNLEKEDCHFGEFTLEQCQQAIALIEQYNKPNIPNTDFL